MRFPATLSLLAACLVMSSCGGANDADAELDSIDADASASDTRDDAARSPDPAGPDADVGSEDAAETSTSTGHDSHVAAPGEGAPLLAIMQKLGADVMTLTYALMSEDNEQVASSAHAIAEHAPIAPDDVERIHHELGDEMAEFERLDEQVHHASVRLHEAAAAGQTDVVLDRLGEVQRGCIECHSRFRERLRTTTTQ